MILTEKGVIINNVVIEKVQEYKYQRTRVNEYTDCSLGIRARIENTQTTFVKINKKIINDTKIRILYFSSPSIWLKMEHMKIRSFQNEVISKRAENILDEYSNSIRNEDVLNRLNKESEIVTTIKTRKFENLSLMREHQYHLLQVITHMKRY